LSYSLFIGMQYPTSDGKTVFWNTNLKTRKEYPIYIFLQSSYSNAKVKIKLLNKFLNMINTIFKHRWHHVSSNLLSILV